MPAQAHPPTHPRTCKLNSRATEVPTSQHTHNTLFLNIPVWSKFGCIVLSANVNSMRPTLIHTRATPSNRVYFFPVMNSIVHYQSTRKSYKYHNYGGYFSLGENFLLISPIVSVSNIFLCDNDLHSECSDFYSLGENKIILLCK